MPVYPLASSLWIELHGGRRGHVRTMSAKVPVDWHWDVSKAAVTIDEKAVVSVRSWKPSSEHVVPMAAHPTSQLTSVPGLICEKK